MGDIFELLMCDMALTEGADTGSIIFVFLR
jgi:hypothetical protein